MAEFAKGVAPYVMGFLIIVVWLYIKGKSILEDDYYE